MFAAIDRQNKKEVAGRRSVMITDATKKNAKGVKITMDHFKIVGRLGNGSFGTVYLVTHKKTPKGQPVRYFAMKTLEKEGVLKQNMARYALTEKNVLQVAGNHPLIIGLNYAF